MLLLSIGPRGHATSADSKLALAPNWSSVLTSAEAAQMRSNATILASSSSSAECASTDRGEATQIFTGAKCSNPRRFKTSIQSTLMGAVLDGCVASCLIDDGCTHFSLAETGQYAGTCMGCASGDALKEADGFVVYSLMRPCYPPPSPLPAMPRPPLSAPPCTSDAAKGTLMSTQTKCGLTNRLFKSTGATFATCTTECDTTAGCAYFSFSSVVAENAGECIGCASADSGEYHTNFNFYRLDSVCSPPPAPPPLTPTATSSAATSEAAKKLRNTAVLAFNNQYATNGNTSFPYQHA
tara:strand:- start:1654 stop:2541 length:888 start_codon:yes stop_codon:yes gene_type:complete